MRSIGRVILGSVFLVTIACGENQNETEKIMERGPNPLETATYECVLEQYKAQGVDLREVHKQIEALAIKTGNLKNNSAQAYYDMFKTAAETNHFPIANEDFFFLKLKEIQYFPLNLNCNSEMDIADSTIMRSKLNKYNILLGQEINNTRSKGLQPNAASPIVKAYKAKDFENEFVQLSMMAFLAYRTSIENEIYSEVK